MIDGAGGTLPIKYRVPTDDQLYGGTYGLGILRATQPGPGARLLD